MKNFWLAALALAGLLSFAAPASAQRFDQLFSAPRTPETQYGPGDFFEVEVPAGMKVVITDVDIQNVGPGGNCFQITQQTGPVSFEVRYSYFTSAGERLVRHFTTGLRLGDETPIAGAVRFINRADCTASVLPRVNGYFTR